MKDFPADGMERLGGIRSDGRWLLTVRSKIECYNYHKKGILLENVDLEGVKEEDLMVTMAGAMHQQMNLHHRHCSSSSSDSEVQKCSKCIESFNCLQKNYDTEREKHNKAKLEIRGYEIALESLESRILIHEKNELAWGEKYEFQNYELKCREIKINNLNLELEKVVKERDDLKDNIAKWEESTKNLEEILNSQMSAKDKTGLGSIDEDSTPLMIVFSSKGKKLFSSPITGNFLTPRADISFAGPVSTARPSINIVRPVSTARPSISTASLFMLLRPMYPKGNLLDESQVVLRAPRKDDVYSLDLKNIVPSGGTQDSYVAGSSGKDKGPTQEYILLPLQPHRTRFPVKDVVQDAQEKPSENASSDKDVQDSEDAADKEEQHQIQENEKDLQDELEIMVTQELAAKAMNDVSRQAFEEEKRRIASQKKEAQATSANADESSFVYLGGKIPIHAFTFPNADLPIDLNMPDLEYASDILPNDGIFNGAYDDDEDVGTVSDINNMDNTIAVPVHSLWPLIEEEGVLPSISSFVDPAHNPNKSIRRATIDKTLFIKKKKSDIMLVQVYVDDIFLVLQRSLCVQSLKNIFVGGLDSEVSDELFGKHFLSSVRSYLGKGCGFVQFANRSSTEEAIQNMHGTLIGKHTILAVSRTCFAPLETSRKHLMVGSSGHSTTEVSQILCRLKMLNHSRKQSKQDLEALIEIDIDDLYNNLRVYEDEMKRSSSSTSTSQNLAFLFFLENHSSYYMKFSMPVEDFEVSYCDDTSQVPSTPCAHDVAYSFFAQPTTSHQLENEDFHQINGDDLDELDLRMAGGMLNVRGTDIAKISRKRLKPDKHGHGKGKRIQEPGECYQRLMALLGSDDEIPPPPPPPQTPTQQAPHTVSTIKLPILKKEKEKERKGPLSFDDLYNNLRVFESDVKGSTRSSSSAQNVAFVSSESTSSTNDVSTAYGVSTSSGYNLQRENSLSYTDELILKKFYKKTDRRLQFDAKEPVEFNKTKVECFNCHKTGTFARECRSKGNQESRKRDAGNTGYKAKDNGRRPGKQEEPKALVTLNGEGVDWIGHAEDEQENFALMAYSNSDSNTEVTSCSKECVESYAKLKKLYDEQREQLGDASIEIQAYTQALKKVEAQLVAHQKNHLWYEEKIRFMKIDLDDKTDVLTYHKKLLAEAVKEKEELKTKLENFQSSSKGLSKLLNSQMSAKDKSGLGYGNQVHEGVLSYENEVFQSVFDSSVETLESVPELVVVKAKVVSQPKFWSDALIIEEYEETVKEQNTYNPSPKADKRDWNGLISKRATYGAELVSDASLINTARPKLSTDSTKIECMKLEAMVKERRIFKCWFHYHTTNGHQFTMSNRHQELASPEQTASGKAFLNPLMADSLPKTI
ncbi:ribonuclease H-like domain-containing protein, partial [Tanacetum coccineum]